MEAKSTPEPRMEARTEPKKQVENNTEAKTEDPGEAEDTTGTQRKQKRKMTHTLFPKWGLQIYRNFDPDT